MATVFTAIQSCRFDPAISCDPVTGRNREFTISATADGDIPFPQLILRRDGQEHIFKGDAVSSCRRGCYDVTIPAGHLSPGRYQLQFEGCQRADIAQARGDEWIKWTGELNIEAPVLASSQVTVHASPASHNTGVKLYFGIHKHMHQPYYRAADPTYWDGEIDGIFASRQGPYSRFIPAAVSQYIQGGLPHAGLTTSWSGSLIEQLDRCECDNLCSGVFAGWKDRLRSLCAEKTVLGNPRISFSAFGYFHPLMALVPGRDIEMQIRRHRDCIRQTFGIEASTVLFPPETAFHVRMIPALVRSGITAVIYDSIHRFRACKEYPWAGLSEGMLPPNPAEQENPEVNDWLQLHNIWAGSRISPTLLRPEYVRYEDVDGTISRIIAVPAERYIGNEDARGGFGALQYPSILGQVHDNIVRHNSHDPAHPPFFILHSDGDNHGGGADSYYNHNTGRLVEWLNEDPRFELTTVEDYLQRFPPDPGTAVHIEPGAWSGADNGDPQFRKWFSRHTESYSPDLNSWAVLTALQNALYSIEDAGLQNSHFKQAQRLMLTAQTSCYWYWTGQEVWDRQVTVACNAAYGAIKSQVDTLCAGGRDTTAPTIFAPWVTPENPGGKTWGQGCLRDAAAIGTVHTFVYDISGVKDVTLVLRTAQGEKRLKMQDHGAYPSQTGPAVIAHYYTVELPPHAGDVRYYIQARDAKNNSATSSLERIFLA